MNKKFKDAFCFRALASDQVTRYIVNVCGDESVGKPLSRSMDEVEEKYLDTNGVDNLIIPIAVGEPRATKLESVDFVVDVVIHIWVTLRCRKTHHLFEHFMTRVTALVLEWIKTECGVTLLPKTCSFIEYKYYSPKHDEPDKESIKETLKLLDEVLKMSEDKESDDGKKIPDELKMQPSKQETKKPLVQELPQSSGGIKKGFLNSGGTLYGPGGSKEGEGPKYDPLGHIPDSLKSRCKIIDTTSQDFSSQLTTQKDDEVKKNVENVNSEIPAAHKRMWDMHSLSIEDNVIVIRFGLSDDVLDKPPLDLEATDTSIELNGEVTHLPQPIDTEQVKAKYVKRTRMLTVTCVLK